MHVVCVYTAYTCMGGRHRKILFAWILMCIFKEGICNYLELISHCISGIFNSILWNFWRWFLPMVTSICAFWIQMRNLLRDQVSVFLKTRNNSEGVSESQPLKLEAQVYCLHTDLKVNMSCLSLRRFFFLVKDSGFCVEDGLLLLSSQWWRQDKSVFRQR